MKKGLLGIMMAIISLPIIVNAETATLSIVCEENVISGNSATCTISGYSIDGISGLSATLEVGNNLELVSVTIDDSWEGNGDNGSIDIYTDENKVGDFVVGTFIVKTVASDTDYTTSVYLNNIIYSDANFEVVGGGSVESSFTVQKTDEPANPDTGMKENLMLLIVCFGLLGGGTIVIKNKNKFFKL